MKLNKKLVITLLAIMTLPVIGTDAHERSTPDLYDRLHNYDYSPHNYQGYSHYEYPYYQRDGYYYYYPNNHSHMQPDYIPEQDRN